MENEVNLQNMLYQDSQRVQWAVQELMLQCSRRMMSIVDSARFAQRGEVAQVCVGHLKICVDVVLMGTCHDGV